MEIPAEILVEMTAKFRFLTLGALLACAMMPGRAADWKPAENPITTPWTASVRPDRAWPEYPRPQMARSAWTNLNGLWDYAITPKDAARPAAFEGSILVPYPIESALSGVKRALKPDQRLWYRRAFHAPDLKGKRLLLHFGAVDWRAEAYVNGVRVGEHEGGYDPFTFDIAGALKPGGGDQEIVVSVWDPTDTALHPRGKQVLNPNGIWYTAVSGIWQTVWLEPVPAAYITGVSMMPDLDGRKLRITVSASAPGEFTAVATLRGKAAGRVSGKTGAETAIPLSALEPWSPDSPTLYDLTVTLRTGDSVKSYFGMRKIELRKDAAGIDRLFLNNQPRFMIGPLDQGWWPDGLYTAPTDEAIQFDIATLKKLGFNMMRKHVKVEPARYYYWCDKLGLMVWQDMPSAMSGRAAGVRKGAAEDATFAPEDAAAFQRELQALVRNLANTPSVIAWVPFNEGWGQHATNDILKLVKSWDPSRLVDAPSGWEDRGYGDMKDMHEYPGPNMYPVVPGRASVLGEFGGLATPIEEHLWVTDKRNWGYRQFPDRAALEAGYEDLIARLKPLVEKGLAAAVYTQTTDVESEINGLMTYDRKVLKFDAGTLNRIHRELIAIGGSAKAAK
jgi:beta-galactosidase/beta-glucuronidase